MTEKTPIEKAAEDVWDLMMTHCVGPQPYEIADIIRRRLEKEVPMRKHYKDEVLFDWHCNNGFNACRRAIGLRDDTEETK